MNNQISRLRNDEAVERERILTELTGMVLCRSRWLLNSLNQSWDKLTFND